MCAGVCVLSKRYASPRNHTSEHQYKHIRLAAANKSGLDTVNASMCCRWLLAVSTSPTAIVGLLRLSGHNLQDSGGASCLITRTACLGR